MSIVPLLCRLFVTALAAWVLTVVAPAFGQDEAASPRLIVRGDDMGFSHSGNKALIKCSLEGIQTSIEVIVPSPWFPEAVKLLEQNPQIDVGIHLALTSEWDNVKWRPVSAAASIRNADGYFFPMIYPNKNYPGQALLQQPWKAGDIEQEFRAQIEIAKRKIPRLSHISGHMGCDRITPEVATLTRKLAKEYQIDISLEERGVKNVSFLGPRATSEEKVESFLKMLDSLKPGETYLFVEHPGLDTPELRAVHHVGYENVAVDRQGVTDCWTDVRVKQFVKAKKIQLISYVELVK